MSVKLTSPVLGQGVGYIYTGNLESWLLAQGYAKRDADTNPTSYSGVGVANTGAAADTVANDPTDPANREAPYFPLTEDRHVTIANDATNLNLAKLAAPEFDFDAGGVDTEAPSDLVLDPEDLPLAGGPVVATGTNLEGVTAVTVGATAVTDLDLDSAGDGVITFTAPAKAAGAHDVVFIDASGNATVTGGLTYA